MTDTKKLLEVIQNSGLKKSFIASKLGLTGAGFSLKVNNESDFRQSEIKKLCDLLNISSKQRDEIFFS